MRINVKSWKKIITRRSLPTDEEFFQFACKFRASTKKFRLEYCSMCTNTRNTATIRTECRRPEITKEGTTELGHNAYYVLHRKKIKNGTIASREEWMLRLALMGCKWPISRTDKSFGRINAKSVRYVRGQYESITEDAQNILRLVKNTLYQL